MAYPHGYVKRNFFTGQFDREFSGQENAITAAGMVHCKNVLTSPQGECKARPGTEYLATIDSESVIIPYRRANRDLALVFSDSKLDIKTFDDAGNLVDFVPSTSSVVTWTNTANNVPEETPVSITGQISGDTSLAYKFWSSTVYDLTTNYATNRLYVPQSTYPVTYFNMRFTAKKALNRVGMKLMQADGNWSADYQQNVKNWINNAVLQYSDDNQEWTPVPLVKPVYWGNKRDTTPNGEIPIPVLWFDSLVVSKHEYWRVVIVWNRQQMLNNAPFLASFATTVYEETTSSVSPFTTPFTTDLLKKLKYSQRDGELFICDGEHYPQVFSMTGNVPAFAERQYGFMDQDGKPSCVRFFQNRLYFGGFATYPTRVRASRFGDYSDFQVETQSATVASPINVECNQFSERITDLWGGFTVLYAQSPDGIAFVTGMSSTPDFTLRCSERASGITPTMKDNFMYYVGYDRRKIHAFSFDNNIQQFVAPDISRYWQEVLKSRVAEIHYVDSRSKCIVGSLEDGTGFLLFHEGGDVGYFPFDINGFISDLSVVKDGDDMHVLAVVQRGVYWAIERFHMPEFMRSTNAFEQSGWDRNLATQENLIKSPFFDSWHLLKNEHIELWKYNAESQTIIPATDSENPTDLLPYIGKTIRCYYGDGVRDYVEARIDRVFSEQQTEEREIEVTETVFYYAFANTLGITVQGISGQDPYVNGYLSRNAGADDGVYRAWFYSALNRNYWTNTPNPGLGGRLFSRVSGSTRTVTVGVITALNQNVVWAKSANPSVGDAVYNQNFEQIGTITAVSDNAIVVNDITMEYVSSRNTSRVETHTETIEIVVEPGEYAVECSLTEDTVFNKIQLPIDQFLSVEPLIQLQDNGVYKGQFEGQESPTILYTWVHNTDKIYTATLSPEVNDSVYSIDGLKIGTISDVSSNIIVFNNVNYQLQTSAPTQVDLYAWSSLGVMRMNKTTGQGTGTYTANRQASSDHVSSGIAWFGWHYSWGTCYTRSAMPQNGDTVYDENGAVVGNVADNSYGSTTYYTMESTGGAEMVVYNSSGRAVDTTVAGGANYIMTSTGGFSRNSSSDTRITVYVPVDPIQNILPWTYNFEEPLFAIQYGVPYRKIGVIEDNRSYLRQKGWGAIAFNIIDTMALKVGIKLDKLTNMIKWDGKQFFDSNVIMKNGTLICNIKDVPQYEKQLIFMTDDGLPFTVLAIEAAGEISDRGAN